MGPDDIELGTKPIRVRRRKRCGVVVSARFTAEEADALDDLAEKRDIYLSKLVRQIVREYLAQSSVVSIQSTGAYPWPITTGANPHVWWYINPPTGAQQ